MRVAICFRKIISKVSWARRRNLRQIFRGKNRQKPTYEIFRDFILIEVCCGRGGYKYPFRYTRITLKFLRYNGLPKATAKWYNLNFLNLRSV